MVKVQFIDGCGLMYMQGKSKADECQALKTASKFCSLILNVVHHCIVLCHLAANLGGDERCGDTEVEGEEQGEDSEQGVQVQHGHHLILAQAGLLDSGTFSVDWLLLTVHTTHSHPI